MESWLFLVLILAVAIFGKNNSLIFATVVVMLLKLLPFAQKWMEMIHSKGIFHNGRKPDGATPRE